MQREKSIHRECRRCINMEKLIISSSLTNLVNVTAHLVNSRVLRVWIRQLPGPIQQTLFRLSVGRVCVRGTIRYRGYLTASLSETTVAFNNKLLLLKKKKKKKKYLHFILSVKKYIIIKKVNTNNNKNKKVQHFKFNLQKATNIYLSKC